MRLHLFLFGICIALTLLLYFEGGATNPFVSLYLVPIAISAATLSIRFTISLTAFCLLMYSLLMFYYQPLQLLSPHHEMILYSEQRSMHVTTGREINWHVVGMWLNFGVSAVLITWFVTRIAQALRVRDAELSAMREKRLRDGQVLGIATIAAGTAHELGTPLATLAILVEDLKSSVKECPELAADLKLIDEQIFSCKQILQNLVRAAEQQQSGALQKVEIKIYLHQVLTHWHLLHPEIPLQENSSLDSSTTVADYIYVDATLEQALVNLLNNAAEASPAGIELSVSGNAAADNKKVVTINLRDFGDGVTIDPGKLGKPFVSTRGQGRGLGLFLAKAAIERLGGDVVLQAHPEGGTIANISFPVL